MEADHLVPTPSQHTDNTATRASTHQRGTSKAGQLWHWLTTNTYSPHWLPTSLQKPVFGYVVAVLLQFTVIAIFLLLRQVHSGFRFAVLPSIFIVLLVSLGWGMIPDIIATLIGDIYLIVLTPPPTLPLQGNEVENIVGVFLFLVIGLTMSIITSRTQSARTEAQTAHTVAEMARQHLYDLLMQMPTPIAVSSGPEHRAELVNPLTRQLFNEGRDTTGMSLRETHPEYASTGIFDAFDQVYVTGQPQRLQEVKLRPPHADTTIASERYFNIVIQPLYSNPKEVYGVMTFIIEVTEQVLARQQVEALVQQLQAEKQALYHSEQQALLRAQQLETTIETITDTVFVLGPEGELTHINSAGRKMLNLTSDATYAQLSFRERANRLTLRDADGQPLSYQEMAHTRVLQGETLTGASAVDCILRSLDGKDWYLNVSGAPVRTSEGKVVGAVCVARDISERRRMEQRTYNTLKALMAMATVLVQGNEASQEARENEEEYRLLQLAQEVLDCKRIGMSALDQQQEYTQPLAVVGLPPELEKHWWKVTSHAPASAYVGGPELLARLLAGEVVSFDTIDPPFNTTNEYDHYQTQKVLHAPMLLGERCIGILSLGYIDRAHTYTCQERALVSTLANHAALVRERKRLQAEQAEAQARILALDEANRLKDEFISIAGHELRTPLTNVKANVQLAKRKLNILAKQQALQPDNIMNITTSLYTAFDRADRQVDIQSRLINDLLDSTRIETGRLELHSKPFAIVPLIKEAIDDQRNLTPERIIRLNVTASEEVQIMGDSDRVRQVFTNYLTNALKYSCEDQEVIISIESTDTQVRVVVQDFGEGLSPEEQQQIWERFYRVPHIEVKSGSSVGLGLGLHICRMIVERQGGQVGVNSTQGQGSRFWFTLPRVTQAADSQAGDNHQCQTPIPH